MVMFAMNAGWGGVNNNNFIITYFSIIIWAEGITFAKWYAFTLSFASIYLLLFLLQMDYIAGSFYDGFLLYAMALEETLAEGGAQNDGISITMKTQNRHIWGKKILVTYLNLKRTKHHDSTDSSAICWVFNAFICSRHLRELDI